MKRDPAAYAAILLLAAIWGYNWVVIKIATADADAFSVSAIRSILGTLCLFIALLATRRSLQPPPLAPTLVLGLLQTTSFTLLTVLAVALGGAGKTAILAYTMPFWVVLMAGPLLHERLSRNGKIALTLAAVGLALVLTPFDITAGLISKMLALCGAVVWAASAVYGKRLRATHPTDVLALTTWQMLLGSVPLVAIAAFRPAHHLQLSATFGLSIAYLAVLGTALGWLLWMFILSRLNAGVAGLASLLTPVVGMFAAWLQLGERPGSLEFIGIAFIGVALLINLIPPGMRAAPGAGAT